jgi:hypothetical protein
MEEDVKKDYRTHTSSVLKAWLSEGMLALLRGLA